MTEIKAYPIKDVARRLQIGRSTLYQQITQGHLQTVKIGKRRLVLAEDLDAFLAAHREKKAAA